MIFFSIINNKYIVHCLSIVFLLFASNSYAEIPQQPSLLLVKGTFNYVSGAWASYVIYDKKKFAYTFLDIATREYETCSNPSGCIWLELKVKTENQPLVITKMLVEKFPDGPGEIKKAAVWIEGYNPFWLPDNFLKSTNNKIPSFKQATSTKILEIRTGRLLGHIVTIKKIIGNMPNKSETLTAYISNEIPPIGIVMLEEANLNIYLRAWGIKNETWMKKEPVSFYWWIMEQLGKALT